MAPNMFLSAMVTPTMPWSLSTGRLITASQVRVSVLASRLPTLPCDGQIALS